MTNLDKPETHGPEQAAEPASEPAVSAGLAIKARPAGLPERAVGCVRKNARMLAVAAGGAAAGMLLVLGGLLIASWHCQSQLGHVGLQTEGPNLVAEVFEAGQDRRMMPSFTVPTAEPVALPTGSYRLRLSAPGRAAETTHLLVESGSGSTYSVGLKHQLLWDPIPLGPSDTARVVRLKPSGPFQVIRSQGENKLQLLDGASAQPVWEWSTTGDLAGRSLAYRTDQDPPELIQPAPDLDGDGVGDLVWACRSSAALWAISGSASAGHKAKELWWFSAGAGETLGVPAVADVDGDGTPDFIATFANVHDRGECWFDFAATAWIEAVSGKTGKSLWHFPLEGYHHGIQLIHGTSVAAQVVQLHGRPIVICAAGMQLVGLDLKTGKPAWPPIDLGMEPIVQPRIVDLDHNGLPALLLLGWGPYNDKLCVLALSLATREPLWQKDLTDDRYHPNRGHTAWTPPRVRVLQAWPWVADLEGGGKPAVIVPIFTESGEQGVDDIYHGGGVELLDAATGQPRWRHRLRRDGDFCDRLLVGPDIDGDGHRDLFVATAARDQEKRFAVFVDALSGKDGHSLWCWQSETTPKEPGHIYMLGNYNRFSGNSSNFNDNEARLNYLPTSLRLWSTGPDGWPQLVVPYNSGETAVLSAGSGRLQQKIPQDDLVQVADLDGDGIADLVFRDYWQGFFSTNPNKLYAIRGTLPEMWRWLGNWQSFQDFDGDGIPGVLNIAYRPQGDTTAISARNGHLLWRSRETYIDHVGLPAGHADLDGDGTPDFLALGCCAANGRLNVTSDGISPDLHAISGRTGKRIWSAEEIVERSVGVLGIRLGGTTQVLACRDLKGDGQQEVVVFYDLVRDGRDQLSLAALNLHDGKTLWRHALNGTGGPLTFVAFSHVDVPHRFGVGALNGDGGLDLVITVPVPPENGEQHNVTTWQWGSELRAVSGRDGRLLWSRPLPVQADFAILKNAVSAPAIGNLGGSGKPQVVVLTQNWQTDQRTGKRSVVAEVLSFDGRTGEPLWKHQQVWKHQPQDMQSLFEQQVLLADIEGNGKLEAYASLTRPVDYCGFKYNRVVQLDADFRLDSGGQLRPALPLPIVATLDLDGQEAILLLGNGKLRLARGGVKNLVWERSDIGEFREILPGKPGQPATVVVMSGESLLGLNAATGQAQWRCPIRDAESILPAQDPQQPPWLISHAEGSTVCRRALATTADGEYVPAAGTLRSNAPLPDDPRVVRALPWVGQYPESAAPFAPEWLTCIAGSIFLLTLFVGTVRRRWRSVAVWLAVSLAATVVVAIVFLRADSHEMEPLAHYSLSGWYKVAYFGVSAAGVLAVLWFIVRLVWRRGPWGV